MTAMCAETQIDAGSYSTYFQKLLALFLIKGYEINDFRIWVEKTKDNKFEEIIFEDENEKVLLQIKIGCKSKEEIYFEKYFTLNEQWKEYIEAFIKMKTKESKKLEKLLTEAEQSDDNESLKLVKSRIIEIQDLFDKNYDKYKNKISSLNTEINSIKSHISDKVYKGVKRFLKQELHIVFTNVPTSDSKKYENNFFSTESFDKSFILRSDAIFFYYNFNTQQTIENLSQLNISKQIIKHFLEKFRVVSIGEDSIHEVVQDCVINSNIFRDISNPTINNKFSKLVNKYFKTEISQYDYFGRIHFLSFLSELWNKNLVEKLTKHIKKINFNLEIIQNPSRLIIKTSRRFLLMLKLLQELNKKNETRFLFVDVDLETRFQCYMIESFKLSKYMYLICFIPSDNSKTLMNAIEQVTNKIRNEQNKKIILITAEDISIVFPQDFQTINDQELFNSCTKIDVDKIKSVSGELENCYISRTLKTSNGEQISQETFLENVLEGTNKFILLSDMPGMGKTALFRQLTCSINKNNSVWAIHIEMNHYIEELLKNIYQHKFPTLETLLDIKDDFEREVLTLPQKTILLIDSIDELFPENGQWFFKFLESLQKTENIKFLFIASRLNIQNSLENFLGITAYKLLEFSEGDCCEFVCKHWKSGFEVQQEYGAAELLRIDQFLNKRNPLEIKMIAEIYKYCEQRHRQRQRQIVFNKTMAYKIFFEAKKEEIIRKKYPKGTEDNKNKILQKIVNVLFLKITESLENLAVRMLVSENKLKFFKIDLDDNYSLLWETLRSVELTKYCNGVYQLEQRMFAEYLFAERICKQLTSEKEFFKDFAEYFIQDIVEEKNGKYQYVRFFLNALLQTEWKNLPPNTLEVCSLIIDSRVTDHSINLHLLPAIQENHIFILELLLNKSKKPEKIINGINALYLAHKNLPMLKFLNSKGGDLNRELDRHGNKLIHIVDDSKTIEYLIGKGIDINSVNKYKQTAMHQAALKNDINIIKYLTENKANINIQDISMQTPLHLAAENGTLETVQYLVEKSDVNIKEHANIQVIYNAALGGNVEIFKYLEKHFGIGIICIEDKFKRNLLHHAINGSFESFTQYLMEQEIKLLKTRNSSILYGYLYGRNSDIFKYLIKNGANIYAKTNNGETVLHRAAIGGNIDVVQYLVEDRVDVNDTDNHKKTALHLAASKGHFNIVKYLVEQGADIHAKSNNNLTVLHDAIIGGNLRVIEYLIDSGIDVNIKTREGVTPLHIAVTGDLEIVKFLCKKNADATIPDNVGKTPIDKANQMGRLDILDYFQIVNEVVDNNQIIRKQNFEQRDSFNKSNTFQYLISKRSENNIEYEIAKIEIDDNMWCRWLDVVKYLVQYKSILDKHDSKGKTALHYAVRSGNFEIVELLINNHSDINARDNSGQTALHLAAEGECEKIVPKKNVFGIQHNLKYTITVEHEIKLNQNILVR